MISRWFQEYKNFDEDMKEEYIHCYLSEERKYLVLDYEKFREAVSKEEAESIKAQLTEAGAEVEIK